MNVIIQLDNSVIVAVSEYLGTATIHTNSEWVSGEIEDTKTKLQLAGYDIQPIIDYENSFNDIENNEG